MRGSRVAWFGSHVVGALKYLKYLDKECTESLKVVLTFHVCF